MGASPNLGLPVAWLLEREGCQVTTINMSAGRYISIYTILNLIKPGAVIMDAGISFDESG